MLVKTEAHTRLLSNSSQMKKSFQLTTPSTGGVGKHRKAANQTFPEPIPEVLTLAREDLNECPVDADLEPRPSRWVTGQNSDVTGKVRPAFLTAGTAIPLHGTVITFMVWFMESQEAGSVSEVLPLIRSLLLCPFLGPYQPDLFLI